MSRSPTRAAPLGREIYELGWVAIHRMLREGRSWSGRERHVAFLNARDGTFGEASHASGFDFPDDGRAVARIDWDRDGAPDLVFTSRAAPRLRILRHRPRADARWLALQLAGTSCNRDAVGARVEVELADGARLIDAVRAGEGYLAQSTRTLHLGLGSTGEVATLHVRWPGGARESFEGVAGPGAYRLVQGSGRALPVEPSDPPARLAATPARPEPPSEVARLALSAPLPLPPLAYEAPGGPSPLLSETAGAPLLVLLWADWCAPCDRELRELAAAREELERRGLLLLALDVDPERSGDLLARIDWPFPSGVAPPALLEALDAVQRGLLERERPLPLPASFLFDARGRLTHVYKGPVSKDTLLADLARQEGTPEETRSGAVPFPGRWLAAPAPHDLARLRGFSDERGLDDLSRFFERKAYQTRESSEAQVRFNMGTIKARQGNLADAALLFEQAAALDPRSREAWASLAAALHELGRPREAVDAYERALALDGRDGPTRYNLALARLALGNRAAALDELEALRLFDAPMAAELEAHLGPSDPGGD